MFKQRAVFRVLMLVGFVSIAGAAQTTASSKINNRYLYILNCQAKLDKFDTLSHALISTTDLAKHSAIGASHGNEVNSVEGCFNYGAAYQPETGEFYTVAPTKGSIRKNVRSFYIFSFMIPDIRATTPIILPGKYDLWDFPILNTERSGRIGIISHNRYSRLLHRSLISASMPADLPGSRAPNADGTFYELDLSSYHFTDAELTGQTNKLAYQPLERSGNVELIKVPSPKQGWAWILVDTVSRHLMRLNLPFHGVDKSLHLSPGGQNVLAQEASYDPAGAVMTKGRLALIDASTGNVIKTWTDPALDHRYILTITPQREMVYYGGGTTTFASINIRSSEEPVIDIRQRALGPYFFYADR